MNETHPSIDQIVDYLHGELPPAQDAAMHAHLSSCRPCDERRIEEVAIAEALRAQASAAERDFPAGLAARIRSEIDRPAQGSAWERLRERFRPIMLLPAAAAAAAAIYVGLSAWHGAPAPTAIDAAEYVDNHAALASVTPFADEMPAMPASDNEAR